MSQSPVSPEVALPPRADVVVVGAGAFGFAVAYQLVRLGAGNVVLLDRDEPGSQVSPRAAGLFKLVQATPTKTALAQLAIQIISRFEGETGVAMPHVRSGSILAARTPEHAAMLESDCAASGGWGVAIDRIDEPRLSRLAPYVEGAGFLAAYSIPDDIYIEEPRSMLLAYRTAGERSGLTVLGKTPALRIRTERSVVRAVVTPRGEIETPVVVDTAGVWSRIVGDTAGAWVPIQAVRHQLRITSPIDGIDARFPIVRIVDAAVYLRPARGGLMVGGFERDPLPMAVAADFRLDQVRLDRSVTDRMVESVSGSVPSLSSASNAEDRGGLFTMTADGRLLAGPSRSVRGLWIISGCNGSGFSLSSGVGRAVAEWIVRGVPSIDLTTLDPDRFDRTTLDDGALCQAGLWQYVNYYTPRQADRRVGG